MTLLEVAGLDVDVRRAGRWVRVVDDVSFAIEPGETHGLVGESGSGKTITALSVMRLLPATGRLAGGRVLLEGSDVTGLSSRGYNRLRGARMGMVFQDPQNSLNPAYTIGNQMVETIRAHAPTSRSAARDRAVALLERVGIAHAGDRLGAYPHQFSGGMAQRVMIALAVAAEPRLLIADEPTTALDVTVQAQILRLLRSLCDELGMGMLLISHDLSVIAEMCDRVAVMYAGQLVETGDATSVFVHPSHPYTDALLGAQPGLDVPGGALVAIPGTVPDPAAMPTGCRFANRCAHARDECCAGPVPLEQHRSTWARCVRAEELTLPGLRRTGEPATSDAADGGVAAGSVGSSAPAEAEVLLEVRGLTKDYTAGGAFGRRGGRVRAVDDVTLDVRAGESVGLVGESGAGKTTVGRLVLGLVEPTAGTITFAGRDIATLGKAAARAHRRHVQVVYQNPYASLDPRMTVEDTVAEPLDIHTPMARDDRGARVGELLHQVGLDESHRHRYPHQLSGGQRQRVAIARALSPQPRLIVCDEPVSSLDVSTQAQVINLLHDVQRDTGVAYLFVGHDLEVVRHISDRVAVMYLGRVVEWGPSETVYADPQHPYTRMLLGSVLSTDPRRRRLSAHAPELEDAAAATSGGCPYAPRCPDVMDVCREVDPPPLGKGDVVARCHLLAIEDRPDDADPVAVGSRRPRPSTG
jgi:peptide/nickel transport system ATP-binding protein